MYLPEVKMHHFHFHPTYGLKSRVILRSRFIRLWQCCNKNRWGFNNKAIHNPETCSTTPYHQRGTDSKFCTICDSEMNHKATQWANFKGKMDKDFLYQPTRLCQQRPLLFWKSKPLTIFVQGKEIYSNQVPVLLSFRARLCIFICVAAKLKL